MGAEIAVPIATAVSGFLLAELAGYLQRRRRRAGRVRTRRTDMEVVATKLERPLPTNGTDR